MKFNKAKFTVQSPIKITVEQQREDETKGREAYLLALKGNLPETKLKNLFSSAEAFNALVASHYDDRVSR